MHGGRMGIMRYTRWIAAHFAVDRPQTQSIRAILEWHAYCAFGLSFDGSSKRPPSKVNVMNDKHDKDTINKDMNRDPITGAPGSHPVGTGVGAAAGGATGAVIGAVGGPVGMLAGAAVGAIVGGLAGKGVGEAVNPTVEDAYWRGQYNNEPYYVKERTYDDYAPAYRTGYEAQSRYEGKRFDEVESDLQRDYETTRGNARLSWNDAKQATRAAWDRVERAVPGDSDRDGK